MCGIAGIVRLDGLDVSRGVLRAMTDVLSHRGPDESGIHADSPVGLGHRRLSILDLSHAGHQPMSNEDGSVWVTFNGEIYNFIELRSRLIARGHRFKSTTDTEVIVRLYEEHGDACVHHLNGMFAFAIWDANRRRLFCARDRLGVKPFYYFHDERQFTFGSEIKALLQNPGVPRAADPTGIADLLFADSPLGETTPFAGVRQLNPGHCLVVEDGRVAPREYWSIEYNYRYDRPLADVIRDATDLLDDAVEIHCRSDAPLGCHLSGGLDSSFVTATAAKHVRPLKAFSIYFEGGGRYDERAHARQVAEAVGAERSEEKGSLEGFTDLLPSLLWHMDYPPAGGDNAGFTYYLAAELAARHVKVSLTGHGGDELFAGYPAQFRVAFGTTHPYFDLPARNQAALPLSTRVGRIWRREGATGILHRVAARASAFGPKRDSAAQRWLRGHCGPRPQQNPILATSFLRALAGYSPDERYLASFESAPTDHVLDRCLHHDLRTYLPQLLHKEDRASMAVSLESRVPFLDYRIVEFMATVPPEQKVFGGESKAVLRAAARDRLPEAIVGRRDKTPFSMPITKWVQAELESTIDRVLLSETCLDRGIFAADEIRKGTMDPDAKLSAMNLELWFRLFIDQDPEWLGRVRSLSKRLPSHGHLRASR